MFSHASTRNHRTDAVSRYRRRARRNGRGRRAHAAIDERGACRAAARAGEVVAEAGDRTPDRFRVEQSPAVVRAQEGPSFAGPGYEQDHWVAVQGYQESSWDEIVALWRAYNRHLAHVIERIPEAKRGTTCTIGSDPSITLGFLASDYVRHLRHHLAQADALPE